MERDLYLRYLGALGVLAGCAVHLSNTLDGNELRDTIERVMQDACAHHPLQYRRILNRIEIEPKRTT